MNAFTFIVSFAAPCRSRISARGLELAEFVRTTLLSRSIFKLRAGAVLLALLQRGPVERVAAVAEELANLSPVGVWLRSTFALAGTLGAINSLAGATVLVATTASPISTTVGSPVQVGFTVTNTINIGSWKITGSIPPGLTLTAQEGGNMLTGPGTLDATSPGMVSSDPYGGGTSEGNSTTTPMLSGAPTQAGNYTFTLQAFEFGSLGGLFSSTFSYTINVAAATSNSAPSFTTQPTGRSVTAGTSVTLTVAVSGSPAPTLQWMKNGSPISGATSTTLSLSSVQAADAGDYTVVATNAAGSVPSTTATLAVTTSGGTPSLPVITRQPAAQTIAIGTTAVLSTDVTASPAATFQWRKGTTAIAGATNATLIISAATAADAGNYSVDVTNSAGKVTSSVASLTVANTAATDVGRLINLSILTFSGTGDDALFVGFAVGGSGTTGTKPLLVRAIGPSLSTFNVGNLLADPIATVVRDGVTVATNDNWAGDAQIKSRITQTGAFPIDDASLDAAFALTPTNGTYSIKINGKNNGVGNAIAEIYDATASMTATTPRLINVSARSKIASSSDVLAAGFVIGGSTSRTVLIRATGPALTALGLSGAIADPKLQLFLGSTLIQENDNWGGDPQLISIGSSVGAFGIADPASKDAVILVTLAPGLYSARVTGVNGSTGVALIEVYEIP
jgi:hypothetical protein